LICQEREKGEKRVVFAEEGPLLKKISLKPAPEFRYTKKREEGGGEKKKKKKKKKTVM